MADVQKIVECLNAPPLSFTLSLMEFSKETPQQLRQLLARVLCFISPNQKKYLESESLEISVGCVMEVLRMFNYSSKLDLQGIASGSIDVIYPILAWMLPQVSALKNHAYLSQFLGEVEIPGELLMDDDVNVLQAQCDALREHFKANYCQLQCQRGPNAEKNPTLLKDKLQNLEAEKDHLLSKISRTKSKLQSVAKADEMLKLVEQCRGEFTEEANFVDAVKEQKESLSKATANHSKALVKMEFMQALSSSPSSCISEKLAQEILMLRYLARTKLPKDLQAKQRHFQSLQTVISDPSYSDDIVSKLQAKLVAGNNELKCIKKRRNMERCNSNELVTMDGEALQWQQSAVVADRLKSAFEKLSSLTQKKEKLVVDLSHKTKIIEEVKCTVLRGEELKQFIDSLRSKSVTYKTLKKEIDDIVSEYGVLKKTQQKLEQQVSALPNPLVSGILSDYCDVKNDPEELDKAIGTISSLISDVNASVKALKQKLGPKVKALQSMKKVKDDMEIVHSEKKHHYIEVSSLYQRKIGRIEADVEGMRKEYSVESKTYQDKCRDVEALESSLDQLSSAEQGATVSHGLATKIQQQEDLQNTLRQRQQKLKEVGQFNQLQMTMMKDVVAILSAKLKQYSSASTPAIYSSVATLSE